MLTKSKARKARIAVFVSGGGTNLQALIDAQASGKLKSGEIVLVVSSNSGAFALKRAQKSKIPNLSVSRKACKSQGEFESKLIHALGDNHIDLIVLAGFMCILSKDFVMRYPERIINVHPSLIPSFCGEGFYGLKVHETALKHGVKVSGATVHFVNEVTDGGKIIAQKAVRVLAKDTPETLQQRIMKEAEWKLLPAAVETVSKIILKEKK